MDIDIMLMYIYYQKKARSYMNFVRKTKVLRRCFRMRSYQYQEPPLSTWPAQPPALFPTSHSDQPNPLPTNNNHSTNNHLQTNLQTSHSAQSSPRRLYPATLLPP